MTMEVALSSDALVSTIDDEISKVEKNLKGTDENLRRLTGRDFYEPRQDRRIRTNSRDDGPPAKKHAGSGVFARLGAPVLNSFRPDIRKRKFEVPEEFDSKPRPKPLIPSSVARPVGDGKSRTEAAAEQMKDKASRQRNRRMFGSLLGTLQAFKSDEARLKDKEDQRAAIDRKLEEKGKAEKEELRREKTELFNQRKEQKARIKNLNIKKERVQQHEEWEVHQRSLANFIRTEAKPAVFWLPKKGNSQSSKLVAATAKTIDRELTEERLKLKQEFDETFGSQRDSSPECNVNRRTSQISSMGEGGELNDTNCADILDYDEEACELDFEEMPSGKRTERVVVQVGSESTASRKVELVNVNVRKIEQTVTLEQSRQVHSQAPPPAVPKPANGATVSSDSADDSSSDSSDSSSSESSSQRKKAEKRRSSSHDKTAKKTRRSDKKEPTKTHDRNRKDRSRSRDRRARR